MASMSIILIYFGGNINFSFAS